MGCVFVLSVVTGAGRRSGVPFDTAFMFVFGTARLVVTVVIYSFRRRVLPLLYIKIMLVSECVGRTHGKALGLSFTQGCRVLNQSCNRMLLSDLCQYFL